MIAFSPCLCSVYLGEVLCLYVVAVKLICEIEAQRTGLAVFFCLLVFLNQFITPRKVGLGTEEPRSVSLCYSYSLGIITPTLAVRFAYREL
jgi:hypothetical membrane protein